MEGTATSWNTELQEKVKYKKILMNGESCKLTSNNTDLNKEQPQDSIRKAKYLSTYPP